MRTIEYDHQSIVENNQPKVENMKANDKIRSLRKQKDLTQEQMAERLDISVNAYHKIEKGQTKLNLERLQELANIFDVDILELINSENQKIYVQVNDNAQNNQHLNNMNFYESNQDLQHEIEKLQLTISYQNQEIEHLKEIIALLKKNN